MPRTNPAPFSLLALACSLALASSGLSAQQTFVVDIGGGGQFTDIPAAIAAAQPGDTLLVRAGTYSAFAVDKGIRIIGEPGVVAGTLFTAWTVRNVPAGESVVIREVDPDSSLIPARVSCFDNLGTVHLENIRFGGGITITNCAQVTLHRVSATGNDVGAAAVVDSSALFSRSTLQALSNLSSGPPGLYCENSDVVFAEGTCRGADSNFRANAGPGAEIRSGTVTVTGDSATIIAAGVSQFGIPIPAIAATGGELTIDPAVQLQPQAGSAPVVGDGAVIADDVASLRGDVTADLLSVRIAAPGALQAITVASPPRANPLPTPFGPFWFMQPLAILDNAPVVAGERSFTRPLVPNLPAGTVFVLQAVVVRPTGPDMSMPAVLTLDT